MKDKNNAIGIIGIGQMGEAFLKGVLKCGIDRNAIYLFEKDIKRRNFLKEKYKIDFCNSPQVVFQNCNIVFLCIKPQQLKEFAENEGKNILNHNVVVSILAGVQIKTLSEFFGTKKIIRIMPNNPSLIGEGVNAVVKDDIVDSKVYNQVINIVESLGKLVEIEEKYFDAITALGGSSPAFIYILIEAMSDAGVYLGLSREQALSISAQTVLGSAKMVNEYGLHPAELKDKVASPAGTTIEGIRLLDSKGFRGIIFEAICVAAEKSARLLKSCVKTKN